MLARPTRAPRSRLAPLLAAGLLAAATLATGCTATVGDAWRGTFEIESNAAAWSKVGGDIGRKRTYFWSLLGDWTLRLRVP